MKPKIAIALPLPQDLLSDLQSWAQPMLAPSDRAWQAAEWQACLAQADAALISVFTSVQAADLSAAPHLRMIASVGVGTNHMDVAACQRAGVQLSNTPGVVEHPTADHAFALLLGAARQLAAADAFIRQGLWRQPIAPLLGLDVHHRTLGIVGLGGIGRQIARRAAGFDMEVLYTQRTPLSAAQQAEYGAQYLPLDELLARADFVVLQLPYNADTHHLIGRRELALMKPSAIVINTARGGVVDDLALAEALQQGRIAGAGLDVFEGEPQIHPQLLQAPNLLLSPHLGSATAATRRAMLELAIENLQAYFKQGRPLNPVVNRL
ncbi:2-hydroxyacid dehydrogenase [Lampropedia aestuarii]|uniref:2-hydroxyacid dehydrogenase n=1 Tax=Lampropedia aestuarii TaxID=2562762 RepID=UPI0024695D55|nr:D-glycerate dehydrogenase [Lampropedia aestuarii]MDH5856578.1 D-glycerate dehydrogenase [Lampropedia aestuarii]